MKLPRPYISWSQITCWENSQKEWVKRYIQGIQFTTKEMKFGKEFADDIEAGLTLETGDEKIEIEVEANYIYHGKTYKLYGRLDGLAETAIIERKTGKTPWTQERAEEHGQGMFYGLIFKINGDSKDTVEYHWHETEDDGEGNIKFKTDADDVQKFIVEITDEKLKDISERIMRYIDEVEAFEPEDTIWQPTPEEIDKMKQIQLKYQQIENIENEIAEIKDYFLMLTDISGVKSFPSDYGSITVSQKTTKKYTYPDYILELEDTFKKEKRSFEKTAECEETLSTIVTYRK